MIAAPHRRLALLVAGCFFMENLDGTIVSTSAARIADSLRTTPTAVGLVATAYLLTLAVLIPLSGWLTARFGPRRVFLTAIVVFVLASLACAASPDLPTLVAMRVLQGFGGALMVPVGRLIVVSGAEKTDIPRLIAYVTWPGLAAPVVAPLIGGLITTYTSWRWLFLINLPLGAVAFAAALRLFGTPARPAAPPPLDVAGVVLTSAGLGTLTFAAHLLSERGSAWGPAIACSAAAAVLLAAAVVRLLRARHPLIDLHTLRTRSFRASVGGGSAHYVACGAVPFLLPLLFQEVFGWSAVKSGAVVLFVFVGNIGIKPATTPLLNRFGFRPLLITATLGVAATLVAFGLLGRDTPIAAVAAVAVVSGAARSLGMTCYNTMAFADVPERQVRHASTLQATTQQVSVALGIAAATVALRAGGPVGHLLTGGTGPATAYRAAWWLLTLIALTAAWSALRMRRGEGDAVRTRGGRAVRRAEARQ